MKTLLRSVIVLAIASIGNAASAATAKDDAVLGKRLFLRCTACHTMSSKAPGKVGPHLQGIVGRKAGSVAGFGYSPAIKGSSIVWNEAMLDKWLERPQAVVLGTTMSFAGLSKPEDRKALIAYLKKPMP